VLDDDSYRCHCRSAVSAPNMPLRIVFPNTKAVTTSPRTSLARVVRAEVVCCALRLGPVFGFMALPISLLCEAADAIGSHAAGVWFCMRLCMAAQGELVFVIEKIEGLGVRT
jgi:hypothetical protein